MITEEVRARLEIYHEYVKHFGKGSEGYSGLKVTHRLSAWTPTRYCEDDWILCVRVFRCSRDRYEIGLFLAEDHVKFAKDAGVMGGLIFSLSDAYFKTGRMEIHFSGPKPGQEATLESGFEPEIPLSVRRVATSLGITFRDARVISDQEGRQLYARLTRFSAEGCERLDVLGIDPIQACFLVNRSVWRADQVEILAREAINPKQLLDGRSLPDDWLEFKHDLILARFMVLGERAITGFQVAKNSSDPIVVVRWTQLDAIQCQAAERLTYQDPFGNAVEIEKGSTLTFRLVPRPTEEYECFFFNDLSSKVRPDEIAVVSKDFDGISRALRASVRAMCKKKETRILSVVDTTAEIDVEIRKRLMQSASTRRPLPERPE